MDQRGLPLLWVLSHYNAKQHSAIIHTNSVSAQRWDFSAVLPEMAKLPQVDDTWVVFYLPPSDAITDMFLFLEHLRTVLKIIIKILEVYLF